MSNCLNDARLQAVVDGEGASAEIDHVRSCDACARRMAAARAGLRDFEQMMSAVRVPEMLGSRVVAAVGQQSRQPQGATTLRNTPRSFALRPAWVFAGGAVAAAVLALLFVVLPSVDSSTRLSAAEILDRSLNTLAGQGVEALKYELTIDAPAAVAFQSGSYSIEQLIDHDTGRWKFARFAPDGTLLNGINENPAAGTREIFLRLDGHAYRFRLTLSADEHVRLWDVQRRWAESMIRLVQGSTSNVVTSMDDGDRKHYVVELPEAVPTGGSALFDLSRARVVIDTTDFHIVEFTATGVVMGESVSIGFRLLERTVAATPRPESEFELPRDEVPTIELHGEGTKDVPRDLLALLLREVARSR